MKVKIGLEIFDPNDQPLMVILTDTDKSNIANMDPKFYKYCSFPDSFDDATQKKLLKWMDNVEPTKFHAKTSIFFETDLEAAIFLDAMALMRDRLCAKQTPETSGALENVQKQITDNWVKPNNANPKNEPGEKVT